MLCMRSLSLNGVVCFLAVMNIIQWLIYVGIYMFWSAQILWNYKHMFETKDAATTEIGGESFYCGFMWLALNHTWVKDNFSG